MYPPRVLLVSGESETSEIERSLSLEVVLTFRIELAKVSFIACVWFASHTP